MTKVKPYTNSKYSKKEQIITMFDSIAFKYDFLNHFFSLGIDKTWRKKAVKKLSKYAPKKILDIATGTGDFAISLSKLNPEFIEGIDISENMLSVGRKKIEQKRLSDMITLRQGDGSNINTDEIYHLVTIAFGIRNFEDIDKGLAEMYRVLDRNGVLCVIEFSNNESNIFRPLFNFYFRKIMPFFGGIISKNRVAYSYLNKSVESFDSTNVFKSRLINAKFKNVYTYLQFFGLVTIYIAEK